MMGPADRRGTERYHQRYIMGRLVWNGFPTGVAIAPAMHHGGPYPATTHSGFTSVGQASARRFLRPVTFQDVDGAALPVELR